VGDVAHVIQAVASSSALQKATTFADTITEGKTHGIVAYGSYKELVEDPKVDIVYVASPHSHHYDHTLLCLNAGKHVLCEKPFTVNAKQTAHLIRLAREKGLFLMEAVWTRFFDITLDIQKKLFVDKVLGKVRRVYADFGVYFTPDPKHRMLNPDLAGGAMLDLGIYSLTWLMVTLFHDPDNKLTPPSVVSSMVKSKLTGVDEHTAIVLNFDKLDAQGIATCSLSQESNQDVVVRIQGEKGEIKIPAGIARPGSYVLALKGQKEANNVFKVPGHGFFYEADACARAIKDGKTETELCPLSESQLTMEILDKAREQNDFKYPAAIEACYE